MSANRSRRHLYELSHLRTKLHSEQPANPDQALNAFV